MNSERAPSSPWLAPMLVALGAALLGLCTGWFLRGAPSAPSVPPTEPNRSADALTREEFEGAQRHILERLDEIARVRVPNPSAPAGAQGAANELGPRLDELATRVAVLERSPARVRDDAWRESARGPGRESTRAILEWQPENPEVLNQAFVLWRIEDVVRQFGKPDRMSYLAPDWSLMYRVPDCAGPDGRECLVFFHFHDDLVTRVECLGTK